MRLFYWRRLNWRVNRSVIIAAIINVVTVTWHTIAIVTAVFVYAAVTFIAEWTVTYRRSAYTWHTFASIVVTAAFACAAIAHSASRTAAYRWNAYAWYAAAAVIIAAFFVCAAITYVADWTVARRRNACAWYTITIVIVAAAFVYTAVAFCTCVTIARRINIIYRYYNHCHMRSDRFCTKRTDHHIEIMSTLCKILGYRECCICCIGNYRAACVAI